jgi:hypothetical protein
MRKLISILFAFGLAVGLVVMSAAPAIAADTGSLPPSANTNNNSVTSPENAYTSNDARAIFNSSTDRVDYYNFGMSVPPGSTVNGIEVGVEANRSSFGSNSFDISLSWDAGTTFTTTKTTGSYSSSTDTTRTAGGPADAWSRTWLTSELSDANFRVRVDEASSSPDLNLDYLTVRVYYTAPVPGITVNPTSGLVTTEDGGQATFTVVLNTQPTSDVTIGINSNDLTEGTVSPASLIFTNANWSIPRTVTVTGVNDDPTDGNVAYTIVTANATSSDPAYNGINPSDVSVTNNDNDIPGFLVTPISGLVTTEAGGTATFTVKLNTAPTADVIVGVLSNDLTEGTAAPASLTFTTVNWGTPQTVTVTGVNDDVADGNVAYSIITTSGGSDAT